MASNKVMYRFGRYQPYISDAMRSKPRFARIVHSIFGFTNLPAYCRNFSFKKQLSFVPMEEVRTILDLGCGQGEFAFMLAEAHPEAIVFAVDIDGHAIKKIEEVAAQFKLTNLRAVEGIIEDLDDGYFDLIFTVDVFQHIPEDEMPFALCWKKLKPGGYLLTKMPNDKHRRILPESWFREFDDTLKGNHEEHNKTYIPHFGQVLDLDKLVKKYLENQFQVISAFYSDGLMARAAWELNYLSKKGGSLLQLATLPICKLLMKIDNLQGVKKRGNYIQVVGRKN